MEQNRISFKIGLHITYQHLCRLCPQEGHEAQDKLYDKVPQTAAEQLKAPFARSELLPDAAAIFFVWHPDVTADVATYTNNAVQKYSTVIACATGR